MAGTQKAVNRLNDKNLWTWNQALAWSLWRDPVMVEMAAQLVRPDVRARYPKPGDPLVRGTAEEFVRAASDGRLTKSGDLFLADQVMSIFPGRTGQEVSKKAAYEAYKARVDEHHDQGRNPPVQTMKSRELGDREWAARNGVSRAEITQWRDELVGPARRGRPRNSTKKQAR
jgi:hypothetical protein